MQNPSSKKPSVGADMLEALLFRLVEANLVLSAEETRFAPQALEEVEDVVGMLYADIAEAITELQKQGIAHLVALGEVPRSLQPSLIDFLR